MKPYLFSTLIILAVACKKANNSNNNTNNSTSTPLITYYINGHKTETDSIKASSNTYGISITGICDKCAIANGSTTTKDTRMTLYIPNFSAVLGEYHADYRLDSLGSPNTFSLNWLDNAYPSGESGNSNLEPYNGSTITITAFDEKSKTISGKFQGKLKATKSGYITILNGTFTNIKY